MAQRKVAKKAEQVALENSFANVAAEWLEHWQDSSRHADQTRRRLASNILPSLGSLQIAEIEAPDIVAMVRAVEARGARDCLLAGCPWRGCALRIRGLWRSERSGRWSQGHALAHPT
jgi:hypothetical protein